ncbi:TPA: MFS transporter [Pseudomonas putida]|uniref:Major facilitator superfamily MFS_1 n=1 Tax=Pseudomonas putida (strain GB-1) TaxID=76869 RepID=B0KLV0_PSEPG|nr:MULTISPECIES: aromatic acid/H+ symport family MFS transporter [Pseudomonas]ABY99478.1 major facilitator superfamily MFS_1 [Pseudomonas putida GB-1]APE99687.1 MFS transporter [Pseudomonas putida]MBP0707093.1 aromatic acid/H+ symport family MFS transporter [Pseudomonas sp. T34]MCE0999502.1 aromatic acid/H+ symport family MFS transporter [Pseudomonas sp. NMI1173_11]MCK2186533.1 aromatic acid/H+ symport family MFS transporter [Pseudomonas sp. MB04B]
MRNINAAALLERARFNAFHARLLFWCALIIIFDGYDLVIYGVVLPSLMAEWGLSAVQAGVLGSCALVGMMAGALFFGSLSDRIGRRKTIMTCVLLFSGVTALNGLATSPETFALCRFVAGLGIGGVMPNVVALMNEYAPGKMRSTLVAIMFSGYSLGGMLSAGLGMLFIPQWGWQAVFYVAVIPLLLLPLLIHQLPESMDFLLRSGQAERAKVLLAQATSDYLPEHDDQLSLVATRAGKVSIREIFSEGRVVNTLTLWAAFFCCLLMVYALSSWLPKLMSSAGYGLNSSLAFLLVLNSGAIVGAIAGGWLGDRVGIANVLLCFFACGALSLSLLALKAPVAVLYLLIAVAGASTIGTQILANACAVQYYPPHIRSTGLGWAMGIGRLGAIVGPVLGGVLHSANLPYQSSFLAFAIPGAIGAVAILLFIRRQVVATRSRGVQRVIG